MTKHLDEAIARVRALPPERQEEAADLLMSLVDQAPERLRLSPAQEAEVERRLSSRGTLADHADVKAFFDGLTR